MNTLPITPALPWLAPLAGYSDLPFRMLCRSFGAAVTCTEMVSVKGLNYKNTGTNRLLETHDEDQPVVVQLFGSDPEHFAEAMDHLLERGFRYFDLNAGCPVRKVTKTGAGARLCETPETLLAIAKIMINKAEPGCAGVKTRLGFAIGVESYLDVGRKLQDMGAGWMTLHPRWGKQMFMGDADWSRLVELKKTVDIPVVASGDLYSAADAKRCIEETGVDAVMFARGALYDPSIFKRFRELMAGNEATERTGEDLAEIVRQHIRLTREFEGTPHSFRKVRSFIPRYAKGLRDIRSLRAALNQCATWEALEEAAGRIAELEPADGI